ncbi:MAG: hypothetical protein AB8G23_05615 [Myxococcota bacterium]
MEKSPRVVTQGIDHVHLNVYQLEKVIELFTSLFQCKHNHPLLIEEVEGINSMNSLGMDCFAPASEDGIWGRMMAKTGEGVSAVSFYVDDLDEATRFIEATGVRKISEIGFPEIERQTQFHPKDCFGMSLELVYLYPDALEKMLAMQQGQAADHGGQAYVEARPGAVKTGGLHHVRLGVKSVEDLDAAIAKFETWFECSWQQSEDGRSATSSLDVHLLVTDDGTQGINAFAMAVPDLDAATRRVDQLGFNRVDAPDYLLESERVVCLAPEHCFGLNLILVESERVRLDRHH